VNTRTGALDALVFGVDVQSGDVRGDAPSYALVVFDGESVERDVVSRRKLFRLVADEEPSIVATDNMYELAENKDDLVHLLRRLPAATKLVQVTGDERPEPLSRVASRHGVEYGKEPMREAEAAARLAARNVGYEVSAFTDETTVKVARGRSTGSGGWSEDRYTRRIHGAVKRAARDVEETLAEAGLDYERDVTEKYGGFSNAVFTVQAPVASIPVSEYRSGDTRIEIEPIRRDGIEFRPLATRRDAVIVGVDPGTTTGLGLVGLDGRILDVWSSRTADTAEVIEWIIEHGRPVVVAADVTPMPETVEKIRRSFNAAQWVPDADLPVDEKLHRTREADYDNDHERDALSAALFAHDEHAEQIERVIRKVPRDVDHEAVVGRVLRDGVTAEAVVDDLTEDESGEESTEGTEPRELSEEEQRIRDLERQVERLQSYVSDLETELEAKEGDIEEYEAKLSEARREERREVRTRREVSHLRWKNDSLEAELDDERRRADELETKLERLKNLWKLDHSNFADVDTNGDLVAVKPVEKFSLDALQTADEEYGIARGDVVFLRDPSGAGRRTAEQLIEYEPRLVVRNGGGLSDVADRLLFEHEIPVAPAESITIQEVDELAVARERDVEEAIAAWERRAKERKKAQKAAMMDAIISEHRADRD
jgi:predicted RNase H-like nuclease (RuvC/YqgF family)